MSWHVVVPVKTALAGKSRLGVSEDLTRAIALDTIAAAAAAREVAGVLVVTSDAGISWELRSMTGVRVAEEPADSGIAPAVARGLDLLEDEPDRAVLLGDVPGLDPADLASALALAARVERAYVADREGSGTVLVTATRGAELLHRFGEGSAARHAALGLVRLNVPAESTLRRDVDTPEQLDEAAAAGLGPRSTKAYRAEG